MRLTSYTKGMCVGILIGAAAMYLLFINGRL